MCASNAIYMPHAQITHYASVGDYANIYATYELTSINHVTRVLYMYDANDADNDNYTDDVTANCIS